MDLRQIGRNVAQGRLLLSAAGLVALYVGHWQPHTAAVLPVLPHAVSASMLLVAYAAYSVTVWLLLTSRSLEPIGIAGAVVWVDTAFAAAILGATGGAQSPFFAFVMFAVVSAGLTFDYRKTMIVTAANIILFLMFATALPQSAWKFCIMRPAYIAVIGWLIAIAAQQRDVTETRMRYIELSMERQRNAARRRFARLRRM